MITREQLELIEEAEDILIEVYKQLNEQRGSKREAKRLDTILGKIYNLKHTEVQR